MRRTPCTGAIPGAALVVVVTVLAVVLQSSQLLVPLLVVGPLFAAVRATPRCTAGVAALAVACAVPLGLVDEFFLTVAPRVIAGDSERIAHGPEADPTPWELRHGFVDEHGFLFLRYARPSAQAG